MTFPITKLTQHKIKELLRDMKLKGDDALLTFVKENLNSEDSFNINGGDLSCIAVDLLFDMDGDMALRFYYEGGDCRNFEMKIIEILRPMIPNDFTIEVEIEW